jgi:pyrrolysine biosynthesis protein PylC
VVEEYLEGPSYSLEVVGAPGRYRALQVTDLAMDAAYDCKRVRAPSELAPTQAADFERESLLLAEALRLKGLMDVEVILHGGRLKILEIDARLPSQTPTAVYWSTGLNMVKLLGELFAGSAAPPGPAERPSPPRGVVYEHLLASPGRLEVAGEHVMSRREPLRLVSGFFGADEALTDYAPGRREWAATLIVTASDRAEAWRRRNEVIGAILRSLGLPACLDPEPAP